MRRLTNARDTDTGGNVVKDQKVVIFDFDGTLADVEPLIRQLYTEFAGKRGLTELTPEA